MIRSVPGRKHLSLLLRVSAGSQSSIVIVAGLR